MTVKVACVQCDVAFHDPAKNSLFAVEQVRKLEADLVVFPEAFLTGYVVGTREEAMSIALPLSFDQDHRVVGPCEPLRTLQEACQSHGKHAVAGVICTDGRHIYNAALLFVPDGTVYWYFKTHLPYLGVDRFVTPGPDLPVFDTQLGRIGLLVCYDLRVPEAARALALQGADLIVLPTNWPKGAELTPLHVAPTRALENRVFVATCNRVGTESGTRFIGQSGIYDVVGRTIVQAGANAETIVAEIAIEDARQKRTVIRPGEYELDVMGSRRSDLYGPLSTEMSSKATLQK